MDALKPNPIHHPADERFGRPHAGWRLRLYTIIFEADTRAGRVFDLTLLSMIMTSVAVVMLDSIESISTRWGDLFTILEWFFTAVFTLEYILRLLCVRHPERYARSVLGVIDLLSILPTYLALFFPSLQTLINVRVLRMLRIFRILKLGAYVTEFGELSNAIRATHRKIAVFLSFVLIVVVVMGTLMYVVEGPDNGFTSVPVSIYWAITTLTTVGFGDITPKTDLGRLISSAMMLMGWGTLAVPTGIVSAEFAARRMHTEVTTRTCHECLTEGHPAQAKFCSDCGALLPRYHIDAGDRKTTDQEKN
ncbi:ion transporter [Propionivibrio sp.]|uniref:ion transporter n=1 Tax=Propionivibrio sp. TaxID=2212460 RepID=UPI0025D338A2|nr:ion transporter [Propionivibrio sp.]MBK7354477.1 ion transporter [Propionivibrio sp.]MBK8401846.1 ion transporter [Propionivibrio sp.]MBK8745153.1 ion transporter [Propionivibrio sp.]MBK8895605.1 ion transporter [Propionivibrio sp.]MBL0208775.1 ion transporter [Propionivibrio sp.]